MRIRAHLDAGGEKLGDDRGERPILNILPWEIRERALLDFDDFKSCEQLVRWTTAKVRITTSWELVAPRLAASRSWTSRAIRSWRRSAGTPTKKR